jgi:hypothetical protein
LPRQLEAPHTDGAQACVWIAGQLPPLQVACSVAMPAAQLAVRQVDVGYTQAALCAAVPSQAPPQSDPSVRQATREGPCGVPLTGVQKPSLPATSQASHWPPQVLLQQ